MLNRVNKILAYSFAI